MLWYLYGFHSCIKQNICIKNLQRWTKFQNIPAPFNHSQIQRERKKEKKIYVWSNPKICAHLKKTYLYLSRICHIIYSYWQYHTPTPAIHHTFLRGVVDAPAVPRQVEGRTSIVWAGPATLNVHSVASNASTEANLPFAGAHGNSSTRPYRKDRNEVVVHPFDVFSYTLATLDR